MSTRCQVRFVEVGLPWNTEDHNSIMLYHHCDGYPTHMLAKILEGYESAIAPSKHPWGEYDKSWQAGRSGKAAAFLIATEPGEFEPESGNQFHSDIEWFYEIVTVNHANTGGVPTWDVRVFTTGEGFWDNPDRDHLVEVAHGDILTLAAKAKEIEDSLEEVLAKAKPRRKRKQPTVASLIYTFVNSNPVFNAQQLRDYVAGRTKSTKAPSSPDRILRDLRKDGKINYRVTNRAASQYEVIPVQQAQA